MSAQYAYAAPSLQGAGMAALAPRSPGRPRAVQPPTLLTTSLNNAHSLGQGFGMNYGQTPASAVSLSSPFAVHNSPYAHSPGAASPMTVRNATGFSAPYNPQQWARMGNDSPYGSPSLPSNNSAQARQPSRTTTFAPRLRGPDEPMASPPPPYSPQRTTELRSEGGASSTASPSDMTSPGTDYSRGSSPNSASTTLSPFPAATSPLYSASQHETRSPNPLYHPTSPVVVSTAFPPPPPSSRVRSASNNRADRLLAAMNLKGRNSNTAPENAIDTLNHQTAHALAYTDPAPARPPATRRAASTGAISAAISTVLPAHGRTASRWNADPRLPGPPPGPPPSNSRTQSLSRANEPPQASQNPPSLAPPRTRQPPGRGTDLETIPPTPADWRDEESGSTSTWTDSNRSNWPGQLHVDTDNLTRRTLSDETPPTSDNHPGTDSYANPAISPHTRRDSVSGSGMLIRSPAVRSRSKGLRERRSESITRRQRTGEDYTDLASPDASTMEPLKDLVLPPTSGTLSRRRVSTRLTPRSSKSIAGLDETLNTAMSNPLSGQDLNFDSARSTPRVLSPKETPTSGQMLPTPPFPSSAGSRNQFPNLPPLRTNSNQNLALKSSRAGHSSSSLLRNESDSRPVSSLLHMPNEKLPIQVMPLSPDSTGSLIESDDPESPLVFSHRAIERHRAFAQKEAGAKDDDERLQLFTQYIIAESRIRRERYAAVFDDQKLDPADLLDGIFETESHEKSEGEMSNILTQSSFEGSRRSSGTTFSGSLTGKQSTAATSEHPVSSSYGRKQITPTSSEHPVLSLDLSVVEQVRRNEYVPCLSPIASMSAVTARDEMDSRGRAPSRWWENHSATSSQHDGFRVLERTKRESKYMSAVFETESPRIFDRYEESMQTPEPPSYGPNEYPPEKQGGYGEPSALPPPPHHPPTPMSAPFTPDPRKMDISRLITFPPPYPRHHPAVNNSHPALADVRNVVRSFNENEAVDKANEAYATRIQEKRQRADSWSKHQRSMHDQDMQYRMEHNDISQAQFDTAEIEIEAKEAGSNKELVQAEFDLYQDLVVTPLHALYTARITTATSSFNSLVSQLHTDAQTSEPSHPHEEGDEQPELLEKLTQLKWLFEARESLHRSIYELLSARNDKYKAIVLLPFEQAHDTEKIADANSFFSNDARNRRLEYDAAALARYNSFLSTITHHVTRGVEMQLSAFWDIAPTLVTLLQQIPGETRRLRNFEILIPRAEVDENPSYWPHPLRYLYSLLAHAEASTRQFIDAQVSLWCLLQEVREAVTGAKWRFEESKVLASGSGEGVGWEGAERRRAEEEMALGELKERVSVVEGQWVEGLGGEIGRVRGAVREFLVEEGGWDEELDE